MNKNNSNKEKFIPIYQKDAELINQKGLDPIATYIYSIIKNEIKMIKNSKYNSNRLYDKEWFAISTENFLENIKITKRTLMRKLHELEKIKLIKIKKISNKRYIKFENLDDKQVTICHPKGDNLSPYQDNLGCQSVTKQVTICHHKGDNLSPSRCQSVTLNTPQTIDTTSTQVAEEVEEVLRKNKKERSPIGELKKNGAKAPITPTKNIENKSDKSKSDKYKIKESDLDFLKDYFVIDSYVVNKLDKIIDSDYKLEAIKIHLMDLDEDNYLTNTCKDYCKDNKHSQNFILKKIKELCSNKDKLNKIINDLVTKNNKINELDNNDNLNKKEFYIQLFDIVPLDNSFKKDFIVKLEELRKEDTLSYSELFSIIADVEENSKYFTRDDGFNDIDDEKKIKNLIDLIVGETKYKNIGGVV